MKLKRIHFTAAFLVFIFGLNMFVGTACAVGINISINAHHHEEAETKVAVHTHAYGKKHEHKKTKHKDTDTDKKDDCCNDKVVKLLQSDKTVPQFAKQISAVTTSVFLPFYYLNNISYPLQVNTSSKYYVRGHHPPIPNILIAIQRFQI